LQSVSAYNLIDDYRCKCNQRLVFTEIMKAKTR